MINKQSQSFNKDDKAKQLLFVYGTLRNPKTQEHVLSHKDDMYETVINGYKKSIFTTPEGKDFSTIEEAPSPSAVRGNILEVSDKDLELLKKWENQYHLISVKLRTGQYAKAFKLNKQDELKKE